VGDRRRASGLYWWVQRKLSFEEVKVCIGFEPDACSAYIVKRRLIWRLPGVLSDREVVWGVRARTLRYRGWPSRLETKEGTEVGRKLVALGRQRRSRKWFTCVVGILRMPLTATGLPLPDRAVSDPISRSWS